MPHQKDLASPSPKLRSSCPVSDKHKHRAVRRLLEEELTQEQGESLLLAHSSLPDRRTRQ